MKIHNNQRFTLKTGGTAGSGIPEAQQRNGSGICRAELACGILPWTQFY
jgi:hypothetical protein